jgi:hypothetical protein
MDQNFQADFPKWEVLAAKQKTRAVSPGSFFISNTSIADLGVILGHSSGRFSAISVQGTAAMLMHSNTPHTLKGIVNKFGIHALIWKIALI